MILTGKAKEDFENWYINHIRQREDIVNRYFDETLLRTFWNGGLINSNAFIIEWLEGCDKLNGFNSFENIFYREYRNTGFKNRKEATEKAIEQANLIYNEKLKGAD